MKNQQTSDLYTETDRDCKNSSANCNSSKNCSGKKGSRGAADCIHDSTKDCDHGAKNDCRNQCD